MKNPEKNVFAPHTGSALQILKEYQQVIEIIYTKRDFQLSENKLETTSRFFFLTDMENHTLTYIYSSRVTWEVPFIHS